MASSAGDDAAIGEAEAAAGAGKKNRRRRISDFLGDSDGSEASPPRLPRFTCARFRFVGFGRKRSGRKAVPVANKTGDASVDSSAAAAGSKQRAETSTSSSSSASAEAAGMGLSMLLLLAARACVELNRMAEVRAQMEALMKEIRDEAGRMKVVVTPPARDFNLQLLSSSSCTSSDTDANRHHATTSSSAMEVARPERECKPEPAEDDQRAGVAAMGAAELEAEPAQHRPILACTAEQEASDESSDDEFIELDDGGRFGGGDLRWGAGDEEEPSRAQHDGGVCAVELERALHELLHRRDRERVEELESALRRAEQRLMEKEMEARLWQDTATLALQPPPPPRDGQ